MSAQGTHNRHDQVARLALSAVLLLASFLAMLTATAELASAQSSFAFRARSYVNPFPQTDRYHLHVFGDYLADGLASGLEEAFDNDGSIKVVDSTKSSAGLARPTRTNWAADINELAKSTPIHIAVVMLGINDIRNIQLPDGRARWGTEEWRNAYANQVDKLIKALKEQNIAVYWVGMPVMASSTKSDAMATMNDIFRERSYINGTKYIDTWSGFTDQLGGFAAYGPDLTGQNKRLRQSNGISFTSRGNRKLANYVEVVLRRDLAAARRERNISLAGDSEEQRRLVPRPDRAGWDAETAGSEDRAAEQAAEADERRTPVPDAETAEANGDQQPDSEPGNRPGPRVAAPAQPSSSVFRSGYAPPGETIVGDISEGVTGLATVSPVSDLNVNVGERRLPVTERLYYKTLVEGEALEPKPGRADNFQWPRS